MIFLKETNLPPLIFSNPLTFFVGENGAGKSTALESIALVSQLPTLGSQEVDRDSSFDHLKPIINKLKLSWSLKTRSGFFFRTEDVLGFSKRVNQTKVELSDMAKEFTGMGDYGLKLARGAVMGQKQALENQYHGNPDAYSHGEAFLNLFKSRVNKPGLYLIDEPEAALSFKSQLGLMSLIKEALEAGSQFIVATHSPILTKYPGATLYNFNDNPPKAVSYKEIENFSLLKDFLDAPQAFLRHIV